MNLLTIKGFSKAYTDKILFDDADFSVNSGEKIGVIGVNGTGKSTLLKIIAGIDECDSGQLSKGNNVVICSCLLKTTILYSICQRNATVFYDVFYR